MKKILLLSLILIFLGAGCSLSEKTEKAKDLTLEEAKTKVTDFINGYLMEPGSEVSIKEASEENGMFKIVVNVTEGQEVISYLTKDGKKFFPQVMDIEEIISNSEKNDEAAQAPANTEIPKQDKAVAELFVMAFCPYGVQAENAMLPVVDLLKDKADIKIRYIASIAGDDINQVSSLHGPIEGIEDARQLCVAKNYDTLTLWKYVNEINQSCYPIYSQGDEAYKKCWEAAAKTAKVDVKKISACVESEGPALIKAEDEYASSFGVSGSPTLIINGVKFNGSRTADAFKTAICNGFNNPPEECATVLDTVSAAASGGCQ